MKKILLITGIVIAALATVCTVWLITSNSTINIDTTGYWLCKNGKPEDIPLSISGRISNTASSSTKLDIDIDLSSTFDYLISSPSSGFYCLNQQSSELSHLIICKTYVYSKSTNEAVMCYFALDLDQDSCIFLFEDSPDYYLVASQDGSQTYEELLVRFSNFITAYSSHIWKDT